MIDPPAACLYFSSIAGHHIPLLQTTSNTNEDGDAAISPPPFLSLQEVSSSPQLRRLLIKPLSFVAASGPNSQVS